MQSSVKNKCSALRLVWVMLAGIGCMAPVGAAGNNVANVVTADAVQRELTPTTFVSGTVISRNDARIAAQVEGQVVEVADVGAVVQQADKIARLDDGLIREQLAEERASVRREQANVDFHAAEVKRLLALAKEHNATRSRLDQAHRDLAVARSEVAAAQARLKQSQQKLDRTRITAPFPGVVTERFIQPGEWADAGTPIVRLVDTGTLEVQARVPASALPFIEQNSELHFIVDGQSASGQVKTRVPVGDDQSRLYEIRLSLDGGDWSAGQGVRIEIPTAASRTVTAVPRDALVLRRDSTSVFRVLDDATAEEVAVTTGVAQGEWIEVRGGLRPGDRVVIRGGERLRSGQQVNTSEQVIAE